MIRPAAAGCCANAGAANSVRHTHNPASSIHHDDLQLPGVHVSADHVSKGSTPEYVGRIHGASTGPDTCLAPGPGARAHAIMTFRGCCELSSRNVFLFSSSSAVGCTLPVTSVTRDTSVCSPGVAPFHVIGEQLPGIFAAGGRIDRRRLPRTVVHVDFDRLRCGVPSFSTTPSTLCRLPASVDARDERLQLHVGDRRLFPFHLAVDHLAAQRAVPARLILAEILILLQRGSATATSRWRRRTSPGTSSRSGEPWWRVSGSPFSA